MTASGPIFGVVEGFYGVFYTFPQRIDLIKFIGANGYNAYLYAPKNDRQHRTRWWEAYPPNIMQQFACTVDVAHHAGVDFAYGISPGQSICYSSDEDFDRLTAKLKAFIRIGVRTFSLMLDDTESDFRHLADRQSYSTLALAQADLTNRLHKWLTAQDPQVRLSFCPVDYSGTAPFPSSLHQIGAALHPDIEIFYTGPEICSPSISREDIDAYSSVVHRPPLLWDNYPVNDLSMSPELHLGPIEGRDACLRAAVRGIYVNPMVQAEATKIPLLTYAAFIKSDQYDPDQAWQTAIETLAGKDHAAALRRFCNHSVFSFLHPANHHDLSQLVEDALKEMKNGVEIENSIGIQTLESRLDTLDENCYDLKYRMENLALRQDLLPWIEVLEHWIWMVRRAIAVVQSCHSGHLNTSALNSMLEYRELIQYHPRRVPAEALMTLINFAIEQDNQLSADLRKTNWIYQIRLPRFSLPRMTWRKPSKAA